MKALVKNGRTVEVSKVAKAGLGSPHDVLIQVAAAGLCRTDVYVAENLIKSRDPLILGHEFSGIVEATGTAVTHIKPGDRVSVMPLFPANDEKLPNGIPNYANGTMLGIHHDGAFSQYICVPASAVYKLPDHVTFLQGAYMEPIAASTAVLNADIAPHQRGLIYGDNRISRLTERVMNAKGFSNIEVFNHTTQEAGDLADDSYDFIIETLATTETMKEMVRAVKPGGRIVLKSRQHNPVAFDINKLVMKDITLQAVGYGDFGAGIDLVASGALKTDDLFGEVFPLEKYEQVFEQSKRGESLKLFFSGWGPDVWDR